MKMDETVHKIELKISKTGLTSLIRFVTISFTLISFVFGIIVLANGAHEEGFFIVFHWFIAAGFFVLVDFMRPKWVLQYAGFLATFTGRGFLHVSIGISMLIRLAYVSDVVRGVFGWFGILSGLGLIVLGNGQSVVAFPAPVAFKIVPSSHGSGSENSPATSHTDLNLPSAGATPLMASKV